MGSCQNNKAAAAKILWWVTSSDVKGFSLHSGGCLRKICYSASRLEPYCSQFQQIVKILYLMSYVIVVFGSIVYDNFVFCSTLYWLFHHYV